MSRPLQYAALIAILASTGCATSRLIPSAGDPGTLALKGSVHGGQQPITGASLQLYAAGQAGNGSAATPLLTSPVLTDASGAFDITSLYTCPAADSQVYLAATGGNPGLPAGSANPAIALMTALGDCSSLSAATTVSVNEVTTVAAAWALAPFASSVGSVGASASNARGLANAFKMARLLADPATGYSPASALPANAIVESAKIYTLANILAACVNSAGGPPCASLFADSGGSASDTFAAALGIAAAPASNVAALYNAVPPQAAFAGALPSVPNDWTVSIAYTGGGLDSPTALAVDGTGNLWVANVGGAVSAFSPAGTPLWQNGITGSGLDHSAALAIGPASNVWVTNMTSGAVNQNAGTVTSLSTSGAVLSGANGFMAGNINLPAAAAADSNGTLWIANLGSSTVTLLASNGTPLSGAQGFGAGLLAGPSAIVADAAHNAWIANRSSGTLTRMDPNGNVLRQVACCGLPDSLALDSNGGLWSGDNTNSILYHVSAGGTLLATLTGNALNRPRALAVDAGNRLYATNNVGNTVSMFNASTNGTPLSPVGVGAGAHLQQPTGLAVDASGTLWVASFSDNRLVAFPGLATPTQTPKPTLPVAP